MLWSTCRVYINDNLINLLKQQEELVKQREEPVWTVNFISRVCPFTPFEGLKYLLQRLKVGTA